MCSTTILTEQRTTSRPPPGRGLKRCSRSESSGNSSGRCRACNSAYRIDGATIAAGSELNRLVTAAPEGRSESCARTDFAPDHLARGDQLHAPVLLPAPGRLVLGD